MAEAPSNQLLGFYCFVIYVERASERTSDGREREREERERERVYHDGGSNGGRTEVLNQDLWTLYGLDLKGEREVKRLVHIFLHNNMYIYIIYVYTKIYTY